MLNLRRLLAAGLVSSAMLAPAVTMAVPAPIDLNITKTITDDTPDVGQEVTFTITAFNTSGLVASGVTVTDTLPGQFLVSSWFLSQGTTTCFVPGLLSCTWDIGVLNGASGAQMTLTGNVMAPGPFTNSATIVSNDFDPNTSDNTASVSYRVGGTTVPVPEPGSLALLGLGLVGLGLSRRRTAR